jgi:hypothetical protein
MPATRSQCNTSDFHQILPVRVSKSLFHFQNAWLEPLVMAVERLDMNEMTFLVGLVLGFAIGVSVLARAWQVDVRGVLKRM